MTIQYRRHTYRETKTVLEQYLLVCCVVHFHIFIVYIL